MTIITSRTSHIGQLCNAFALMEGLMALFVLSMFFYAGFGTFLCWLRDDWNAKNLTTIIGCAVLGVLLLFAFFGPMIFSSGRKANDREEDK